MEIIAHRGASAIAPENTLKAIKKAIKHLADGVEVDLRVSKDKHIIIYHNKRLKGLKKIKASIRRKTLKQLKNFKIKGTEPIPTLKQVLRLTPKESKNFAWHLEIKNRNVIPLLPELVSKYQNKIIFSSFRLADLLKLKKILPHSRTALLKRKFRKKKILRALQNNIKELHLYHKEIDDKTSGWLEKHGVTVRAWVVNDKKTLEKMKKYGVKGIITNRPHLF